MLDKLLTKENFIEKYGIESGTLKWNNFCIRNKGNHTLKRFVELYGDNGIKRFNDLKNYFVYSNTLNGFISRYGESVGIEKYENRLTKMLRAGKCGYSPISQVLFNSIYTFIKDDKLFNDIYFASLNKEFTIGKYKIDFLVNDIKRCIEFNGDNFHANPEIYTSTDTPNPFDHNLTASEIWKRDLERLAFIKQSGYTTLVVWENEFNLDRNKTIKRCLDFIYE